MKLLLILFLWITWAPTPVQAQEKVDLSKFSTLPILHEGRIKPLDSFADVMLKKFSGKDNIDGQSSSEWLAETLFDPASAVEKPVFKIFDAKQYNLNKNKNNLYSYIDLSKVIENKKSIIGELINTPPEQWIEQQKALMDLHENYILMTQILRSLTLLLPININDQNIDKNYLSYQEERDDLNQKVKNIIRKKGTNLDQYSKKEILLSETSYHLNVLEQASVKNIFLRIIPTNWNKIDSTWQTPWATIKKEEKSSKTLKYINSWESMALAYRAQNSRDFKLAAQAAMDQFETSVFSIKKIKTEKIYNDLNLLYWAQIFYIFSFSLLLLFYFYPKQSLEKIAFGFLTIGLIDQIIHTALRIYILGRPPVGTLYESILFVAMVCVAGFVFMAFKQKNNSAVLLGSLSGIILLLTAQGFSSEDTMSTLVAVLNTNFWLSTHVLCISIGYSLCLITSLIGHSYLVLKAFKPNHSRAVFNKIISHIKTLAILSLLFTTIGTILGGIWADQSWGRFWGWDPKENGALLIVLWLVWILHGRISHHIDDLWLAITTSLLSVIVVLAWFGVNLLNIGLHSYGFISGIAWGIGFFCIFETTLLGGLWLWIKR